MTKPPPSDVHGSNVIESNSTVSFAGKQYSVIKEGQAEILRPHHPQDDIAHESTDHDAGLAPKKSQQLKQTVFYNPIQQFNRDLTVLVLRTYAQDWTEQWVLKQAKRADGGDNGRKRGKKRKRDPNEGDKDQEDERHRIRLKDPSNTQSREPKLTDDPTPNGDVDHDVDQVSASKETVAKGPTDETPQPEEHLHDRNRSNIPPLRILDALSATGLRALRFAKEIPQATSINANDLSCSAIEAIKTNIAYNGLTGKITTSVDDANAHLRSTRGSGTSSLYHIVDLDPYGTAAPFLDAAVQALSDGGLLCVTCTDAGVYASVGHLEKCYSLYGGLPLKGPHAHEAGLRLILHAIASSAARYGIAIEPLLSLSIDFYARVFVRIHKSPAEVKFLASKTMLVFNCDHGCGSWEKQFLAQSKRRQAKNGDAFYTFTCALAPVAPKECQHCGYRMHLAGPMWGGALHNPSFVRKILDSLANVDEATYKTAPRIKGMLSIALEETLDNPMSTSSPEDAEHPTKADTIEASVELDTTAKLATDLLRSVPPIPAHYRNNHPFFIQPPYVSRALNVPTPSDAQLRGALRHLGYRTAWSHTKAGSIVTDAPWAVIWEIMREWIRHEGHKVKSKPSSPAYNLMQKDRSRANLEGTKREIEQKVMQAQTLEELKTELEAGLGRLNTKPKETITAPDDGATTSPDITASTLTNASGSKPSPALHELKIHFDEDLGREELKNLSSSKDDDRHRKGGRRRLVRYQVNPPNWGPLEKAVG